MSLNELETTETGKVAEQIIRSLLDEIYGHYISDSSMIPLILNGDRSKNEKLQVIDSLHQSILTSLQFGQYRRAVWYLRAFAIACDHTLGKDNIESMMNSLRTRFKDTLGF